MVRVLSYNIHSGVGNDGVYDLTQIAGVIRRSGADIACLQEVEFNSAELQTRKWSKAHADRQPATLSRASGLNYWSFVGPLTAHMGEASFRHGEVLIRDRESTAAYGNAILSRFPILDKRTLLFEQEEPPLSDSRIFMDSEEQPRGACAVLVDAFASAVQQRPLPTGPLACCMVPSKPKPMATQSQAAPALPIWVVNTHLSHRFGSEEQRSQARQLLDWIDGIYHSHEGAVRPGFVLCGDLNAPPFLPLSSYTTITSDGRWRDLWREKGTTCAQATFPSSCLSSVVGLRIDHIFALHGDRAARLSCNEIRILSDAQDIEASDHYAVVADISIDG
mmetsp:Transcript_65065/g.209652  ORF Transcript_65065/g.209652 Transcript_65065/m.209652 type:complete len:334 (-) Transcript_65065:92-1093(-)